MSADHPSPNLPTLPPEIIGRILSLAAAEARVGASGLEPISPFLRQLSLISRDWRHFGQGELLREVDLSCPGIEDSDETDRMDERGHRLIESVSARPELGKYIVKLNVQGSSLYHVHHWDGLLKWCTRLRSLVCTNTTVNFYNLEACQGEQVSPVAQATWSRLEADIRWQGWPFMWQTFSRLSSFDALSSVHLSSSCRA